MKNYELTYLIKPETLKEEISELSQKINSLIQDQEGIIEKDSQEQTRTLGYPIKGNKNVFLKTVVFKYNPEKLPVLDKYLKEEKSILRFLIIKIEKKKRKKKIRSLDKIDALVQKQKMEESIEEKTRKIGQIPEIKEEAKTTEKTPSFMGDTKQKEKKVELKDIDKKLEEILEE